MTGGRRTASSNQRQQPQINYDKIKWRLNPDFPRREMIETGIETVDAYFGGGLRKGLHTFYGPAGTGKSKMARSIALALAEDSNYVLYVCCEVLSDAPEHDNVDRVDYTRYIPNAKRALSELQMFIEKLEPSLVIIDSMTSFFSVSRKALPESELREIIAKLHMDCEGEIPIIGISEVRGKGYNEVTAGGTGVQHACNMLVYFERQTIRYRTDQEAYNMNFGDTVFWVTVEKDKWGLCGTKRKKVTYDEEDKPVLS